MRMRSQSTYSIMAAGNILRHSHVAYLFANYHYIYTRHTAMNFRRYLITFLFFVNIFSSCILFTTADGDKDEQAVPVSKFSGPSSGNLGALLRVIDRDPEIKYLYAKMQAYIVGRIQRAAVGEPRVGDEEEIFETV